MPGDALGRDVDRREAAERRVDHPQVGLEAGGDAVDRGDRAELVDVRLFGRLTGELQAIPAGAERQPQVEPVRPGQNGRREVTTVTPGGGGWGAR